jgi:hypothetical protein
VASVDLDGTPVSLIGQGTTTLFGIQTATHSANPTTLKADAITTSLLSVTVRDRNGNLVPDGTRIGITAAPIYTQTSAGGTILGGTTSTGDPRIKIFTTVGGQCTATYRSSTIPGNAVIQGMTLHGTGRPTGLAGTITITLQ